MNTLGKADYEAFTAKRRENLDKELRGSQEKLHAVHTEQERLLAEKKLLADQYLCKHVFNTAEKHEGFQGDPDVYTKKCSCCKLVIRSTTVKHGRVLVTWETGEVELV